MTIDLVIFDCDGVLVDSEVLACEVHADALTKHGYAITADEVHDRFLGRANREMRFQIETELGRALSDDYSVYVRAEIDRVFGAQLQPMPNLKAMLPALTQRICVASSGTPTRIRSSLTTTGLIDHFAPHLFSAADITHGKPAPDLFLYAAEQMNVAPHRCLVIEDSIAGVMAGLAAGMTVLGFTGGSHCRAGHARTLRELGAWATFDDMTQLPEMIMRIPAKASLPAIS